jgi:hypothetical protein
MYSEPVPMFCLLRAASTMAISAVNWGLNKHTSCSPCLVGARCLHAAPSHALVSYVVPALRHVPPGRRAAQLYPGRAAPPWNQGGAATLLWHRYDSIAISWAGEEAGAACPRRCDLKACA